jgi:hypothetical protein
MLQFSMGLFRQPRAGMHFDNKIKKRFEGTETVPTTSREAGLLDYIEYLFKERKTLCIQ